MMEKSIKENPVFKEVNESGLKALFDKVIYFDVKENTDFFSEINFNKGLIFVTSGSLKWTRIDVNGEDKILEYFGAQDAFIIDNLIDKKSNSLSLYAMQNTSVAYFQKEVIDQVLLVDPLFRIKFLSIAISCVETIEERAGDILIKSVNQRVGKSILRLIRKFGINQNQELNLPLNKNDFCNFNSISRTSLNRLLAELNFNDTIIFKGNVLCVLNLDRLKSMFK